MSSRAELSTATLNLAKSVDVFRNAVAMKPLAIATKSRILLIAGNPKDLENVTLRKSPRGNFVIIKKS